MLLDQGIHSSHWIRKQSVQIEINTLLWVYRRTRIFQLQWCRSLWTCDMNMVNPLLKNVPHLNNMENCCKWKMQQRYGLLVRLVKLPVAHAPGMPGTFSAPQWVRDPDMHHGTGVTHVPWCMPGSLTSGFFWSGWRGKRSRLSRRMRNP